MSIRRINIDQIVYLIAFASALIIRLFDLGALPLSDTEAGWALQAWNIIGGRNPVIGPNPAYVLLTSVCFFFQSNNFFARFWPAIAGSLLVLAPYLFQDRIGRRPAVLLTFLLVFDPGLIAVSREAGSSIFAIAFLILAWAFWQTDKPVLAGISFAVALLGGPTVWVGILVLGISWIISSIILTEKPFKAAGTSSLLDQNSLRKLGISTVYGLGTILLGGTLLFFVPNGLSAFMDSLVTFFTGWKSFSGTPLGLALLALPAYAPLGLVFGIVAMVRGFITKDQPSLRLSVWVLVALLFVIFYPAKQVTDVIWITLPLYALSAFELNRHFDMKDVGIWELMGALLLDLVILIFIVINLANISWYSFSGDFTQTRLMLILGMLLFMVASNLLIGIGWSKDLARLGIVMSLGIMLGLMTIAFAFGAAGYRHPQTVELWHSDIRPAQAALLLQTAEELSEWETGHIESLGISIYAIDSHALEWLLRDWPTEVINLPSGVISPPMVITPQNVELGYADSYRGQDFVWQRTPVWDNITTEGWLRWFIFRQAPHYSENLILWAREDILFEGDLQAVP